MFDFDGRTTISCFNCGFKTAWTPGSRFTTKWKDYFQWLGMPKEELDWLGFYVEELRKNMLEKGELVSMAPRELLERLEFKPVPLPKGAKPITFWLEHELTDPDFLDALAYLSTRGDEVLLGADFYWTPEKTNGLNRRVIIPFFWEHEVVGWTARVIDNSSPMRYFSEVQPRYLFNTEAIKKDWEFLFVCEGPFDGIAINGIAMLGDKVMPDQARWLNQTGKKIIVVPDRVEQGGKLVDTALSEGWYVSFPRWDTGIKDAADAVKAYGKLYTVWSIIDAMTKNKLEIGVRRQRLV
jgi:hypothetical protein